MVRAAATSSWSATEEAFGVVRARRLCGVREVLIIGGLFLAILAFAAVIDFAPPWLMSVVTLALGGWAMVRAVRRSRARP